MGAASAVILTGGSSGGLATYLTCDRVGAMVKSRNSSTRFSCLADAGLFLDHPDYRNQPSTSPEFEESFYAWNSTGGTNQDCIAHYRGTPEKCIFAQYVLPFIKSELFVMQNLYDSWQVRPFDGNGLTDPDYAACQHSQSGWARSLQGLPVISWALWLHSRASECGSEIWRYDAPSVEHLSARPRRLCPVLHCTLPNC